MLCAHEKTKHVCKILRLNSKRLLRKPQKNLGGYFILPHPVCASILNFSDLNVSANLIYSTHKIQFLFENSASVQQFTQRLLKK